MKILMVNKFLYPNGGSETYIFEAGKQLKKMGHEVQYFGMEHEGRVVGNHAESYTADMDFHGGGIAKLLYPFRILYSVEARKKIRRVLEDFSPDVVHLNNFNFQLTPSIIYEVRKWAKQEGRKVPLIYTAHDYQWVCPNHMLLVPSTGERCFRCEGGRFGECAKHRCIHNSGIRSLLGTMEAYLYRGLGTYGKVDTIICPSNFMKEKLASNSLLADKLVTLYNFLNMDEVDIPEKKDYILYFGRYSEEKGVRTLLEVCKRLPQISFLFAGTGPLKEELAACDNVTDLGFLQGADLKKTIAQARFSVFPSEWYENCPFTVMETQKYKTPVVASNIGGVPELVRDGFTGSLFEAGNADELEAKIRELWENRELCQTYAKECGKLSFADAEEYCERLLEIYRKAGT